MKTESGGAENKRLSAQRASSPVPASAAPTTAAAPASAQFNLQSAIWTRHFELNRNHMGHVPWDDDCPLSEKERSAIARSIAVFQLGENAEGKSFKRAGQLYAERTGDHEYLNSLNLFIKEEQSHSAALGRFMEQQNIPTIEKEWTDSSFRFLRRLAGLNVCITILITAEIVAAVYYRALGRATRSPVLRAICGQILIDEAHHLRFQAGTLAKERSSWHPLRRWLFNQLHRIILMGTILVVWKEHRTVYRAGRLGFFQWCAMTWAVLEDVLLTIGAGVRADEENRFELPLPAQTDLTVIPELPSRYFNKIPANPFSLSRDSLAGLHEIGALIE